MPKRAFQIYQRKRVININVNVFLAGLFSIAIAKYPIMVISDSIGHEHKLLISILAYVIDTVIDVLLYFGLHWIANHWRPMKDSGIADKLTMPEESRTRNYLVDVGRVQAERFALVPIFAVIATGGMYSLQRFAHTKPSWAFVIAFIIAMCITRIIHTIWGYKTGSFVDDLPVSDAHYIAEPGDLGDSNEDTN